MAIKTSKGLCFNYSSLAGYSQAAKNDRGDKEHEFVTLEEIRSIAPASVETLRYRRIRARKDLEQWLKRVGLPYHSPHKFRHGNAVYSLKNAKDVSALKAVSQNLMHANLSVTDGVYGILSDRDVRAEIVDLSNMKSSNPEMTTDQLVSLIRPLLERLD